jgi:hypothetical protein
VIAAVTQPKHQPQQNEKTPKNNNPSCQNSALYVLTGNDALFPLDFEFFF